MDKEIIIKPKYTLKEYLRFVFTNKFNSFVFKFIIAIAFLMLIFDFLFWFNLIERSVFKNGLPTMNIVFPFLIFLGYPTIIYFTTKKSFNNNFRLKEDFSIIFNSEYFQEKGETFDVKTPWKNLKLVSEDKNNFLIKHSKPLTSFYPKRFFTNQQIIEFRELIRSVDIKNRLK